MWDLRLCPRTRRPRHRGEHIISKGRIMTIRSPGNETLRTALSLAIRAPSIHNSQPWHWQVGAHSVHLYADESLRLAHTDPDARDFIASCGAAFNHCAVALAAAIARRRTDRRRLSDWPVSLADIALMGSRAARAGVTHATRRADTRVPNDTRPGRRAARSGPEYLAELTGWTGRHASTVGVPARNTPKSDPESGVVLALGTATDVSWAGCVRAPATSAR